MKTNWVFLLFTLIISLWKPSLNVNGFSLQAYHGLATRQLLDHSRHRMSSIDDSFDDDELSKLIGKRNQIKRKRKPAETTSSEDDDDMSLAVPLDKINLDEMPSFQTPRPVRQRKRDSDDDDGDNTGEDSSTSSGSKDGKKKGESDVLYMDFTADYADENEFHIPNRIGFSTRAWGDASLGFTTVPTGKKLSKTDLRQGKFVAGDVQVAFNQLMQGGVVLGDTSEVYGASLRSSQLSAEHILSQCIQENPNTNPLVSTTMANHRILQNLLREGRWPYSKKAVVKALTNSCQRLELASVELYQVSSLYWGSASVLSNGLAQAVEQGLCNYVGVQHANRRAMQSIRRQLDEQHGIQLISNAFEFSLTNRRNERLIEACKDMGVIPLIQQPLDVGDLASGRYTATNPSGGLASLANRRFSFAMLEKLQPLHSVQETVAERVRTRVIRETRDAIERSRRFGPPPKINTDITTTQVAINYVVAKGGVPLVSVNTPKDAQEVLGCLGWSLTEDDVEMLDAAASLCGL